MLCQYTRTLQIYSFNSRIFLLLMYCELVNSYFFRCHLIMFDHIFELSNILDLKREFPSPKTCCSTILRHMKIFLKFYKFFNTVKIGDIYSLKICLICSSIMQCCGSGPFFSGSGSADPVF